MANTNKTDARAVKDIKTAAPRTQVYVAQLTRKHGATAQELKEAVIEAGIVRRAEGFTSHNSYSLQLLAATYGFRFWSELYEDGKRYFFASVKNDPKLAAAAEKAKQDKAAAKLAAQSAKPAKASRKAAAKPADDAQALPDAAVIAKASRKSNSAAKA